MFCQSARFVREHQGNVRNISIFGQESNPIIWKLSKMNLAIRQLEANLGKHNADSFHDKNEAINENLLPYYERKYVGKVNCGGNEETARPFSSLWKAYS